MSPVSTAQGADRAESRRKWSLELLPWEEIKLKCTAAVRTSMKVAQAQSKGGRQSKGGDMGGATN